MSTEMEPERVSSTRLWRGFFRQEVRPAPNDPIHCAVPTLRGAEVAALYYDLRRAEDFYEFLRIGRSRMLFALLDMAGRIRATFCARRRRRFGKLRPRALPARI
jgi:hypothetical protein